MRCWGKRLAIAVGAVSAVLAGLFAAAERYYRKHGTVNAIPNR